MTVEPTLATAIHPDVTSTVGNTPLVRINRIIDTSTSGATVASTSAR